jgi:hypothetical protein
MSGCRNLCDTSRSCHCGGLRLVRNRGFGLKKPGDAHLFCCLVRFFLNFMAGTECTCEGSVHHRIAFYRPSCLSGVPNCCAQNPAFASSTEIELKMVIQGIHKRLVQFQMLLKKLFFTLHGHNIHSQQRELSRSLMRYKQFASHAYCGAAGPVSKMASQQEKAFCVPHFEVSRSVIVVQREFRAGLKKDALAHCFTTKGPH